MHQRWVVTALLGAVVFAGACGGNPDPETETPDIGLDAGAAGQTDEDAERRRAEQERLAREREREMAEARRAREILDARVHFDLDQSRITTDAQDLLTQKVAVLRAYPEVRLRIAGHADERGSTEYNLALGQQRAQSVKDYFVNYGLAASRFETVSFGEERPLATGSNENAWAQNRRAEFTVIAGAGSLSP